MEIEAAEKWIVDLIRGSQLDAKIDSRDNNVIMGGTFPSVYQQVSAYFPVVFLLSLCNEPHSNGSKHRYARVWFIY